MNQQESNKNKQKIGNCRSCLAKYQHVTERPCRDCKPLGKGVATNG